MRQGGFARTSGYRQRLIPKSPGRNHWEKHFRLGVTVNRGGWPIQSVAQVSRFLGLCSTRDLPRKLETPEENGAAAQFRRVEERTLRILATTFKFCVERMSVLLNTEDNNRPQSSSGNRACSFTPQIRKEDQGWRRAALCLEVQGLHNCVLSETTHGELGMPLQRVRVEKYETCA